MNYLKPTFEEIMQNKILYYDTYQIFESRYTNITLKAIYDNIYTRTIL